MIRLAKKLWKQYYTWFKTFDKNDQYILIGLGWFVGMYLFILTPVGGILLFLGLCWWIGWTLSGMK